MTTTATLRPLERTVLKLEAQGVPLAEIARRFRRSPRHIDQVLVLARLPGRAAASPITGLRPLERRVLDLRLQGLDHAAIGERFKRSPAHIARVEDLARYKQDLGN